jgi:hypothetical protein
MSSESAKPRATALPSLDWQGELDSAMTDLDTRLTHPRRRATDAGHPAAAAEAGRVQLTAEMVDEIAWRVAEQLRRTAAEPSSSAPPQSRTETAASALAPGKLLMIRYKMPILPWPFSLLQRRRRRKQHPLTTARLRA